MGSTQLPAEVVEAFSSPAASLWGCPAPALQPLRYLWICVSVWKDRTENENCFFQAVLGSVGEFSWLLDHGLISWPRIKRGGKKSSPSAHLAPSVRRDTCVSCAGASLTLISGYRAARSSQDGLVSMGMTSFFPASISLLAIFSLMKLPIRC